MREKVLYEYAVIRVLPRVDREEFINVGVIVYCQSEEFLRAEYSVDEDRLTSFAASSDLTEVRRHLDSVCRICSGSDDSGPIGKMSLGERFRWLTSPRSTVVQTSQVHTGLTLDPEETLEKLVSQLIR
ncbi:MAG: DUF3037 domain-containing protein [Pyrinomonadaceae bacterium]